MTKTAYAHVRCDPLQLRSYHERAREAGLTLSEWFRRLADPPQPLPGTPAMDVTTRQLCDRCERIGVPCCARCKHVFFGEPLPPMA